MQETTMNSVELAMFMMINTMGMSVLTETLRCAAEARFPIEGTPTEAQECYSFIQGTGLMELMERFQLGYDPNSLKFSFNYYYRHQS